MPQRSPLSLSMISLRSQLFARYCAAQRYREKSRKRRSDSERVDSVQLGHGDLTHGQEVKHGVLHDALENGSRRLKLTVRVGPGPGFGEEGDRKKEGTREHGKRKKAF